MDTTYINQTEKDMSGHPVDRLKLLYPNVDEKLTPLPRSWSSQEKCNSIGLTQNNLRVHYKGFYANSNYLYKLYLLLILFISCILVISFYYNSCAVCSRVKKKY